MRARIPVRGSGDELDRLAAAINAMLDRISALMENLRQVTSDIAHDLRTPVTHLRSRLERADSDGATAAEYRQALQAAIAKTDDILAQFAALLRIAQIEGGERRAGFAAMALGPLLLHMREMFGAVAEEAGHRLEVDIRQDATIRGDRELLVQLFSNLIENAILHTPAGCHITLTLEVKDDRAIATVRDDGPGVPREEHEKLFRRLYRREASRTRPGYGLGLSLVTAIVELHGAKVEIVELPTPGLCVKLTFPV
jgi:signal transduction histidine kinase